MTTNLITLNAENFVTEVIASQEPILVDFWAPWCGPCRVMNPIISEIARDYSGVLQVAKLSIDDAPEIASQYHITAIPTLILFDAGEVREYLPGLVAKQAIAERLQKYGFVPTAVA